jgi:nucleoid DNA-binding protein
MEGMEMSKVGLKELAAVLTAKHGLKSQDAEKFTKSVFDVLNNGLHYEKQLKVKGLGTFKVTSVSARKSIDVNTGNPIEIAERDKISFIPDSTMKDLINRPFSQFQTVLINEGVDFPDLEEPVEPEQSNGNVEDDVNIENQASEQKVIEPLANVTVESENNNQQIPETMINSEEKEEISEEREEKVIEEEASAEVEEKNNPESEEPSNDEKQPMESDKNEDIPVNEPQVEDEQTSNEVVTPLVNFDDEEDNEQSENVQKLSEKWANSRAAAENRTLSSANDLLRDKLKLFKNLVNILGVISFLLLIVCCIGAYYVSRQFTIRDNRIQHLEAQMHLDDVTIEEAGKPSSPLATTQAGESKLQKGQGLDKKGNAKMLAKKKTDQSVASPNAKKPLNHAQQSAAQQQKAVVKIQKSKAKAQEPAQASKYNNDARVRTGAYSIIGIDQIVTVRKGQSLKSLSKFYLGSGMECYIQAVNGGISELKEGQKIKIPKLKIKKK